MLYRYNRYILPGSQSRIWIALVVAVIFITYPLLRWKREFPEARIHEGYEAKERRFANFNNETGTDDLIVPNIIHFVVFKNPVISFPHFVSILAAMRNQRPEKIYFHTNVDSFKGEYWTRLMSLKQFTDILIIKKIEMPTEIFNQPLSPSWRVFHGSDIARIRILMEYGGIYQDNDSYIVKSLDYYRKFEMVVGLGDAGVLGNWFIVAHKDARFLELWLNTYNGAYNGKLWYYNAGELPKTSVLDKRPELVHAVRVLFGGTADFAQKLLQGYWPDWRENYVLHVFVGHQYLLENITEEAVYPVVFNEFNLQRYPITYREMANEVLDFEKSLRNSGN